MVWVTEADAGLLRGERGSTHRCGTPVPFAVLHHRAAHIGVEQSDCGPDEQPLLWFIVTAEDDKAWELANRLIKIACPRSRWVEGIRPYWCSVGRPSQKRRNDIARIGRIELIEPTTGTPTVTRSAVPAADRGEIRELLRRLRCREQQPDPDNRWEVTVSPTQSGVGDGRWLLVPVLEPDDAWRLRASAIGVELGRRS